MVDGIVARAADHKGLAPLLGHERPEVANLVLLAALCTGADPADPADPAESIGERGRAPSRRWSSMRSTSACVPTASAVPS